jgi:putative dimethyl sulfoxide reductase chaperone
MQPCVSFLGSDKIGGKSRSEAENVNLGRARIYDFLSRAFKKEIDEHFVEVIASTCPTLEELSESQNSEEMKEGSDLLLDFTDALSLLNNDGRKWLISNLAAEYAQLFLKAGPCRVDLVESVYLGKYQAPYEEPYFEVMRIYGMLGFEKEKDFTEPEDHVAIELEFMTNLCRWTARTLESGNVQDAKKYLNLQKEFLTAHVMRWVPKVCLKLRDTATSSFYRSLAYLTSGFIALDEKMPSQIAETLAAP